MNYRTALLSCVTCALFCAAAQAQIYRWVDDQGNVHFGDKPLDAREAAVASPVELQQSYQPTPMSDEERAAAQAQESARWNALIGQREDAEEAAARREQAEQERRAEKEAVCARVRDQLARLSGITYDENGRRVRTYVAQDGRAISAEQQRELVAQRRAEFAAAGCE